MIKIHILSTCTHCSGDAYLPSGEGEDANGHKYTRYIPCPMCEGSGNQTKWISLIEFIELFDEAANIDPLEPDYQELAQELPVSQYQDSRDSAGI